MSNSSDSGTPRLVQEPAAEGNDETKENAADGDHPANKRRSRLELFAAALIFLVCTAAAALYVAPWPCEYKPDGKETRLESWFQAGFVVVLTILAFQANSLEDIEKRFAKENPGTSLASSLSKALNVRLVRWAFFAIPTFVFLTAMIARDHRDAAVFLMAIVAIFVAAEHFVSLSNAVHAIESVNTIAENLGRTAAVLSTEVTSIRNALGKEYSQSILYSHYAKDWEPPYGGIYAVYHLLDIDKKWHESMASARGWDKYFTPDGHPEGLYAALIRGRRPEILIITDMRHRASQLTSRNALLTNDEIAKDFLRLMGLIWYVMVVRTAATNLRKTLDTNYAIRVVKASTWMHVVDKKVFQVFGTEPDSIYLRELTMEIKRVPEDTTPDLVAWATKEIKREANRGVRATDYICSSLCHALLMKGIYHSEYPLDPGTINKLLSQLGLDAYAATTKEKREKYEPSFCELVRRFLHMLRESATGKSIEFEQFEPTVDILIRELQ
ncbi:hypothetical protein AWB79_00721 [Caballeronia hypogeia]|uniref:Transmembrane protein n=1 Tax=Caballeronia hypogeia TaxID=1777140 RepID=A0A157ZE46_9BURK|nr:hypothetical protein [Caballeronia hypogeia]SAK43753.1 hypothetical protein AWB79_00721 [Caballeronia hypogeia]